MIREKKKKKNVHHLFGVPYSLTQSVNRPMKCIKIEEEGKKIVRFTFCLSLIFFVNLNWMPTGYSMAYNHIFPRSGVVVGAGAIFLFHSLTITHLFLFVSIVDSFSVCLMSAFAPWESRRSYSFLIRHQYVDTKRSKTDIKVIFFIFRYALAATHTHTHSIGRITKRNRNLTHEKKCKMEKKNTEREKQTAAKYTTAV